MKTPSEARADEVSAAILGRDFKTRWKIVRHLDGLVYATQGEYTHEGLINMFGSERGLKVERIFGDKPACIHRWGRAGEYEEP